MPKALCPNVYLLQLINRSATLGGEDAHLPAPGPSFRLVNRTLALRQIAHLTPSSETCQEPDACFCATLRDAPKTLLWYGHTAYIARVYIVLYTA